jgi:outer membrane protein assembly factor BamD
MMTFKKILAITLSCFFVLLQASCSSVSNPADAYPHESAQEIYQKGVSALRDKSYHEAVKRLEALDVQYPFEPVTENAQLYLIYAYYMKEEYALAISMADRFIHMHPTNPNVDYAYYLRGVADYYQNLGIFERLFTLDLATRDMTQLKKAYFDFNELVTRFPQSKYAPAAHQFMIYLRNIMADHQLHVAQYYYNRRAYMAAANRADSIIAHYQGAPVIPDALVLLVKAYKKLEMNPQSQAALKLLEYNYPNKKIDYRGDYQDAMVNHKSHS